MKPPVWTDAEVAILHQHYPAMGGAALMAMLPGRSQKAIQRQAHDRKVRLLPETLLRIQRATAIACAPKRAAEAYAMRMAGRMYHEIAAALGYTASGGAAASVKSYAMSHGLPMPPVNVAPPKPKKPRPSRAKPKELHKSRAPKKKRTRQATKTEARPLPPPPAQRFVAESPEEWLARHKPRRAEMVTLDTVLEWMRAKGYAPRRAGKEQNGERYHIKGFKPPLPARSLVDIANRYRIARDPGATQWIVSGLYAQPAGMLPRDCRPSVLRNAA